MSTFCATWIFQVFCLIVAWVFFYLWPPASATIYDLYIATFYWSFKLIMATIPCVFVVALLTKWEADEEVTR